MPLNACLLQLRRPTACPVGVDEDKFDYKREVQSVFSNLQSVSLRPYFEHVISYVNHSVQVLETGDQQLIDMLGYKR